MHCWCAIKKRRTDPFCALPCACCSCSRTSATGVREFVVVVAETRRPLGKGRLGRPKKVFIAGGCLLPRPAADSLDPKRATKCVSRTTSGEICAGAKKAPLLEAKKCEHGAQPRRLTSLPAHRSGKKSAARRHGAFECRRTGLACGKKPNMTKRLCEFLRFYSTHHGEALGRRRDFGGSVLGTKCGRAQPASFGRARRIAGRSNTRQGVLEGSFQRNAAYLEPVRQSRRSAPLGRVPLLKATAPKPGPLRENRPFSLPPASQPAWVPSSGA